ncbi:type VI secretion protein IcmF/TssM N-terminal domain-containing protein, partial [Rhizobium ruizarguesonis]
FYQHGIDTLLQQGEFLHEAFWQICRLLALVEPERRAPDLFAVAFVESVDELLHARVPVYLLLTKADMLTGFVEFFD